MKPAIISFGRSCTAFLVVIQFSYRYRETSASDFCGLLFYPFGCRPFSCLRLVIFFLPRFPVLLFPFLRFRVAWIVIVPCTPLLYVHDSMWLDDILEYWAVCYNACDPCAVASEVGRAPAALNFAGDTGWDTVSPSHRPAMGSKMAAVVMSDAS